MVSRDHVLSVEIDQANLDLQEINKFSTHLKDPKFMELFAEYAKELADPKVTLLHLAMNSFVALSSAYNLYAP